MTESYRYRIDASSGITAKATTGENSTLARTQRDPTLLPGFPDLAETEGPELLAECAATCSTLGEWERRASAIRRGILSAAGLDPLPERTPLNPILRAKREHAGYSATNVAFESVPGLFVTGVLYRPLEEGGEPPAILCPHGHYPTGIARPDHQARCARLARMGAVVLAYDMVGYRESTQTTHADPNALSIQLWNSIRCVDFVLSVCNADPTRVAVTGSSGGGTQSFLLAAVDERVRLSAPVVMVSAHFFGGCHCESGKPIHKDPPTNNVEIAALAAPRAQLIVSCAQDWTRNSHEVEVPYIRNVYRLYGSEGTLEHVHFPLEGHDYGYNKRAAVYEFVSRHFGLQRDASVERGGESVPEQVTIEDDGALRIWTAEHRRPPHALEGEGQIARALFGR